VIDGTVFFFTDLRKKSPIKMKEMLFFLFNKNVR